MSGLTAASAVGAVLLLLLLLALVRGDQPTGAEASQLKVLQLTDLHLDAAYTAGSETACACPPCCHRPQSGLGPEEAGDDAPLPPVQQPARPLGEYKCDSPLALLHSAVAFAAQLKPDIVLITGDFAPHELPPDQAEAQVVVLESIRAATAIVEAALPGVPLYGLLGNADFVPKNTDAGKEHRSWLTTAVASIWRRWLPNDAQQQLSLHGYYEVPVTPSLHIVALNTQCCYVRNFHVFVDDGPASEQLQWLRSVLDHARAAGIKCLIAGHVPPGLGSGCWGNYSAQYQQLVSDYADVIVAQLYGHMHTGSMRLMGNTVAYVTPSLSPHDLQQNPSFRIYTLGAEGVTSFEQYSLDLSSPHPSNEGWEMTYNPLNLWEMEGMTAKHWQRIVTDMKANGTMLDTFLRVEGNNGQWMQQQMRRNRWARENFFCILRHASTVEHVECIGKSEEMILKMYLGQELYELTALFPFPVLFAHFCSGLPHVGSTACALAKASIEPVVVDSRQL
eukprot:jgi/Chlat1/847/Chrsp104S00019